MEINEFFLYNYAYGKAFDGIESPRHENDGWHPKPGRLSHRRWRDLRSASLSRCRASSSSASRWKKLLTEFVRPHFRAGDWIALSEKLVSISQNRVRHISTVKVTWLARFIRRGVKKHKNMTAWNNPEKIQVAIEEAGLWRIIPAMVVGVFGKLIGQRGWFWIVAGNRVSEIDGFIPEDMYPYTEWAVLPAADPQGTCEKIEHDLGMPCMTGDMNFIDVKI